MLRCERIDELELVHGPDKNSILVDQDEAQYLLESGTTVEDPHRLNLLSEDIWYT
jgi:hypothetical protein